MNRVDEHFASMGTRARVRLESSTVPAGELERLAGRVRAVIEDVAWTLTRFDPASELSRLNRDPRPAVPASALMGDLARAARWAALRSGGLVDATLLADLEDQGYVRSRAGVPAAPLDAALAAAPARRPASGRPFAAPGRITVDADGTVRRPPGLRLDSGGLGKGLAADRAAAVLPPEVRFAISCGGDLRVGSAPRDPWGVAVTDARTGTEIHRLAVRAGGIATSGIHARLWQRADGSFAHHVLDPSTGAPAWTGLVAATAVAGTALEAEVLAKMALLSGPDGARRLLRTRGGVLQHDDGGIEVIAGPPVVRIPRPRLAA